MSSNLRSRKKNTSEEESDSLNSRRIPTSRGRGRGRGQIRMSASSSGTDGQQGSISTSRKRHSPSSGPAKSELDSSAAPAASSAVQNAASLKQRKVINQNNRVLNEDGETSGGHELRYLTDFFPDQPDNVRFTRSRARNGVSSPNRQPGTPDPESSQSSTHDIPENETNDRSGSGSSRGRRTTRVARSNQEPPMNALTTVNATSSLVPPGTSAEDAGVESDNRAKQRTRRGHKSANPAASTPAIYAISARNAISDSRVNNDHSNSMVWPSRWDPAFSRGMDIRTGMSMYPHLNMQHMNQTHPTSFITRTVLDLSDGSSAHQIPVIQQSGGSANNQPSTSGANSGIPIPFSLHGMLYEPPGSGMPPVPTTNQARTAARTTSVASHFFHGLVPRMQHLLGHRSPQHDSRVTNILDGMRSSAELRQNEAVLELGEMLLMANEDSIPSQFPIREITHLLIEHLQKEHNFELMLNSARCLRNLLEAIPRAQPIVIDAVPYLLEKLKRIECVDVAEQALSTLEDLSRRNAKTILAAGGIAACISHVDFFSIASQRLAFSIAANCASFLGSSDFHLVRESLPDLTERLLNEDKRCLESVYQLFCRLVDNLKSHPDKLKDIAGVNYRLLTLVQQHLMTQPCQLSGNVYSHVIRMVRTLACRCPEVSAALIRMDYHSTIRTLFTGSTDERKIDIVERPPNQLQDMVLLLGELFPRLPTTGLFEIDSVISKTSSSGSVDAVWYWQDEKNAFQAFKSSDSKILELAQAHGQAYHDLNIGMFVYRIDLREMNQRNLSTGAVRTVRRVLNPNPRAKVTEEDGRLTLLQMEPDLFERVLSSVFPLLVAIDGSSSGAALRYDCLRVMLRMICPMPAAVLRKVLADLPLSGHIASALASPRSRDLSIVIAALQVVHILLEKLSDIYAPLFRKEGVAHEVQKLAAIKVESSKSAPCSGSSTPSQNDNARMTRSLRKAAAASIASPSSQEDQSSLTKSKDKESRSRKRNSPESSPVAKKEKDARRKSSGLLSNLRIPGMGGHRASSSTSSPSTPPLSNPSTLVDNLQPGPSSASVDTPDNDPTVSQLIVQGSLSSAIREKYRAWIKKEAELLLKTFLNDSGISGSVIDTLSWVAEQLQIRNNDVGTTPLSQLHDILLKDSVSAFEMTHSGVITALHTYLCLEDETLQPPRKLRLKRFAAVFLCLTPDNLRPAELKGCFEVFESLVSKTLASVAQLEQFQVKVNDMGGVSTGTSNGCLRGAQALRFFQNHQIKCSLRRHPNCKDLKDYQRNGGSTIKVDPFTSISSIERYLMDKGINRPKSTDDSSGDEISDEEDAINSTGSGVSDEKRIEILLGDTPLPSQMSVLQALRQYLPMSSLDTDEGVATNMWMTTHVLFYRSTERTNSDNQNTAAHTSNVVSNPAAKDKKHKINDKLWLEGEVEYATSPLWSYLTMSLAKPVDDPSVTSLLLLRALYGLNKYWFGLFDDEDLPPTTFKPLLHTSVFHCPKLTAKLQRQMSDFISVATQQIPVWAVDLVKAVPFLFAFSLRRTVVYSTSFGRDRALMHLVSQSEGSQGEGEAGRLTPRLERRKIVVKRDDLMKSSESALASSASSRAILEASFEGEAGTGFGPTLEFYSTLSREMQNVDHKMWHGVSQKEVNEDGSSIEYTVSGHGLYPSPYPHSQRRDVARMKKFELLGRLMGQALVDCRMLDLPLSPVFLHWLVADPTQLGVPHMELLDPQMYSSLRNIIQLDSESFDDLEQYFTMPGNEQFELMKGGRNKKVTKESAVKYMKLVSWWRLAEGVWREMEAVKKGFSQVVDPTHLSLFEPEELDQLFCGCSDGGEKVWGEAAIAQAIKPDHGYTHDSEQVRWLVRMLSSFNQDDQRKFVQFVTGSPRLPVGGFKALNPPLTVVRKTASYGTGDEELPSAMTCYNYLKIPAYSSYEVFQERFNVALQFIYSFHLT